jgi:hypothetical protein
MRFQAPADSPTRVIRFLRCPQDVFEVGALHIGAGFSAALPRA